MDFYRACNSPNWGAAVEGAVIEDANPYEETIFRHHHLQRVFLLFQFADSLRVQ
jgi:hypothetical protein